MTITASGFGGGSGELVDLPNCTQVVIGRRTDDAPVGRGQPAVLLETNLDDVTGEQLGRAVAALIDAGAHDAWVTPATMKKGRPAHILHALCDPALVASLRQIIMSTTGTLGVRALTAQRWPVAREIDRVQVEGQSIRVKVSPGRVKAEFDDVARAAARTGLSLHEVAGRAEAFVRERDSTRPGPARPGPGRDGGDPEPA
jgi:uncharacterized protein (DUF111 family)